RFSRDWSSDVCSSDLRPWVGSTGAGKARGIRLPESSRGLRRSHKEAGLEASLSLPVLGRVAAGVPIGADAGGDAGVERVFGFDQIGRASGRERVRILG